MSNKKPLVTIKIMWIQNQVFKDAKPIVIELEPDLAPETVKNFIQLTENGFYNNLVFHRVIADFMVQTGDPHGMGDGGPEYAIFGEFKSNGFDNPIKHERGTISMARAPQDPNSAGSQFFICVVDCPHLDGEYAAFGHVVSGMETVDMIANFPCDRWDRPERNIIMESVTVDTFGVEYELPHFRDLLKELAEENGFFS